MGSAAESCDQELEGLWLHESISGHGLTFPHAREGSWPGEKPPQHACQVRQGTWAAAVVMEEPRCPVSHFTTGSVSKGFASTFASWPNALLFQEVTARPEGNWSG